MTRSPLMFGTNIEPIDVKHMCFFLNNDSLKIVGIRHRKMVKLFTPLYWFGLNGMC